MTLIYAAGRIITRVKPLKHFSFLLSAAIKKKTESRRSEFKFALDNHYQPCYIFMQAPISNFEEKRGHFGNNLPRQLLFYHLESHSGFIFDGRIFLFALSIFFSLSYDSGNRDEKKSGSASEKLLRE